jgi:hypothetical protein
LSLAAGDSKAAKKLASLSSSIPALDEQISAYEAALDFAIEKDKADALEAGLLHECKQRTRLSSSARKSSRPGRSRED